MHFPESWFGYFATRMRSSVIEYSPTTTTPTLDVHFIASRAAPAIAEAAVISQHLACVALNLL